MVQIRYYPAQTEEEMRLAAYFQKQIERNQSLYEQIQTQTKEIEQKDARIDEMKRRLEQKNQDILRIGTRLIDCPACQKNHVITDLPGEYDLCAIPRSHWKGGPIPITVVVKADGTIQYLAYGQPITNE